MVLINSLMLDPTRVSSDSVSLIYHMHCRSTNINSEIEYEGLVTALLVLNHCTPVNYDQGVEVVPMGPGCVDKMDYDCLNRIIFESDWQSV